MRTILYPGPHTRYVQRLDCPLTEATWTALVDRLAELHVRAERHRLTTLRLRADQPLTTWDEVQAVAAVRRVTDMRVEWGRP